MRTSIFQCHGPVAPTAVPTLFFAALLAVTGQLGCAARPMHATLPAESGECAASTLSASELTPHTWTDGPWVGSSKADVMRVRGLPDERRDDLWLYRGSPAQGALEVLRFSGPRVVSVSQLLGGPVCRLDS